MSVTSSVSDDNSMSKGPTFTQTAALEYQEVPSISKGKKPQVIVIGAGMAGLSAARQLKYFGFDVVVLEARERIGGRIATFTKDEYLSELGAMIITGLGGNPLSPLTKQLSLELTKIKHRCPLFDSTGGIVPKAKDDLIEKEFNKLLETTTFMSHQLDLNHTAAGRDSLSLGEALELVIKMQEKNVKENQIRYFLQIAALQQTQEEALLKMKPLSEEVARLLKVHDQLTSQSNSNEDYLDPGEIYFLQRKTLNDLTRLTGTYRMLEDSVLSADETMAKLQACPPADVYLSTRDRQVLDWHFANLEFANATPLENISLKHWDQDDDFAFKGSHLCVRNGFATIPTSIAEGLDIKLGRIVKKIEYGKDGDDSTDSECGDTAPPVVSEPPVTVTCCNSASGLMEKWTGDAVLVTLPLGVLKDAIKPVGSSTNVKNRVPTPGFNNVLSFVPSLPQWKTASIQRLGFGNLNKVVLCFDRVFWDASSHMFGHVGTTTASRGELYLFWSISKSPVLIALVAGSAADVIEHIHDDIVLGRCVAVLKDIFGASCVPTPREAVVTRWRSDMYARGSYSYVGINASGSDYDLLAAPVSASSDAQPLLFFAGEHTCRNYPATVHGAMLSGHREAARIADQFFPLTKQDNTE